MSSPYRRRLGPGSSDPDDPVGRELDEEVEVHLDLRTEELVKSGMSPEDARVEARRRFGDDPSARRRLLSGARKRARRRRRRQAWEALLLDVRLSVRQARLAPGFTTVALLILASGVGLATSMFTVADNVLLRPLPHPDPHELVALWSVQEEGSSFSRVSMANWVDWKEGATALETTALYDVDRLPIATGDDAFYATTASVAGPFFSTMGGSLAVGRPFTEDEAQNGEGVAVVSEEFWRRALGGVTPLRDAELVVSGRRYEVVGVVARGHGFPATAEVWRPMAYRPGSGGMRNNINYEAVARLGAGATLEQARAELSGIADGIRERDPEALYSWGVDVRPLRDVVVAGARTYLVLLSVAVGCLLLVACANLAGLSLARARRRGQESAVHLALGAGRGRLVRRTVIEHLLLGAVGGGVGVVVAWLGTDALMSRAAAVLPRAQEISFDPRVAAFGLVIALASGLLAGVIPAVRGTRAEVASVLSGTRGGVSGGRGLPGAAIVGVEIALAVTLLVAGGLLVRSFQALVSRDLGFSAEGVVTAEVTLTAGPYWDDMDARLAYWHRVLEQVDAVPAVSGAAIGNWIPTTDGGSGFIEVEGSEEQDIGAGYRVVSDAYFQVLGIPLLSGRSFTASDGPGSERVVIVNEAMAERYWPDGSPQGRRVRATSMESWSHGGVAPWLTVVGVVANARHYGFDSPPQMEMYVLHRQIPSWVGAMTVVAKTASVTPALSDAVREAIRDVDPALAIEMGTLEARVAGLTRERRMVLAGIGVFGTGALLLVSLGIYGVMSFAAGERTREMAVRAALGAESGQLVALMLGAALRVVAAGVLAGLVTAYWFSGLLTDLLVEVGSADPATYLAATLLLVVVALLSALVPSLRAAGRDPLEALRSER